MSPDLAVLGLLPVELGKDYLGNPSVAAAAPVLHDAREQQGSEHVPPPGRPEGWLYCQRC
jgi:hypothetical protein